MMHHGTYRGPSNVLGARTALLQRPKDGRGGWLAQFDDLELGIMAHGWHWFDASCFPDARQLGAADDVPTAVGRIVDACS